MAEILDRTQEQLWHDPDWTCPNVNCQAVNYAIRSKCRICGYDSNCGEFPWYDPMPPYETERRNREAEERIV